MEYNVQMLVTGTITKKIVANDPEEALEIANEKYGDRSITLCCKCSEMVEGLSISGDEDTYCVDLHIV